MQIKLYGQPTSNYEFLKYRIKETLDNAQIAYAIEECKDTSTFIENQLQGIPAVNVGDQWYSKNGEDISLFANKVANWLLSLENYGNMKQIIVPTDFSEASENALSYAIRLAQNVNGVVNLVHIYHPVPVENLEDPSWILRLEKATRAKLEEYVSKYKTKWFGEMDNKPIIKTKFVHGFAVDQILELSSEYTENGIIVMGTTGSGKMKKIFGSVSTAVAQHSKVPVLLIPPSCEYRIPAKIMYCTNDPVLDASVAETITDLAKSFDSQINLIHVIDDHPYMELNVLNIWKSYYPKQKLRYNHVESKNNILEGITRVGQEKGVDWIVMSKEKRGFFENIFTKSLTRKMSIITKWPLLIINH